MGGSGYFDFNNPIPGYFCFFRRGVVGSNHRHTLCLSRRTNDRQYRTNGLALPIFFSLDDHAICASLRWRVRSQMFLMDVFTKPLSSSSSRHDRDGEIGRGYWPSRCCLKGVGYVGSAAAVHITCAPGIVDLEYGVMSSENCLDLQA